MTSPRRSPVAAVLGVVLVVVGVVWIGQGLNLIPGSFMTGDPKWFVIGAICVLVGLLLIVVGMGRPRSTPQGLGRPD